MHTYLVLHQKHDSTQTVLLLPSTILSVPREWRRQYLISDLVCPAVYRGVPRCTAPRFWILGGHSHFTPSTLQNNASTVRSTRWAHSPACRTKNRTEVCTQSYCIDFTNSRNSFAHYRQLDQHVVTLVATCRAPSDHVITSLPQPLIVSRAWLSTNSSDDKAGAEKAVESTKWNIANVRRVLREYGTVAVVFHTVMSLGSLGTCYTIVNM